MNWFIKTLAVAGLSAVSTIASADAIAGRVGIEGWQYSPSSALGPSAQPESVAAVNQTEFALYAVVELPLPLLPDLALRRQNMTLSGQALNSTARSFNGVPFPANQQLAHQSNANLSDITLFYQLLDNQVFQFDLGITGRYLDTESILSSQSLQAVQNWSVWLPMLYVDTRLQILGTDTALFFNGNYYNGAARSMHDYRIGISYDMVEMLLFKGRLFAGWQQQQLNMDDIRGSAFDWRMDGIFVGFELAF